ncbi:SCO2524 family protein [Streptomyces sp. NPDC052051]|uniref:SCO2524 family protein n=1 Tax=Streptomyces sp. NPDC052051 TaxID=3154649 RepID=UPI003418456F
MQIKPRQHLLDIWQAIARQSFDGGEWDWGKRGGQSSVADAERLLCLLYPATEIPAFRLDDPDTTQDDVQKVLKKAGGRLDIPANLVTAAAQFMRAHTGENKSPTFAGGYYFVSADDGHDLSEQQRQVGVVESYSLSITLCLATLGFLKVYETKTRRSDILETIQELRSATSKRLTAAMVCLLRSFTVNVFDVDSSQGSTLCELLGQGRLSPRHVVQNFQRRFRALRAAIVESMSLGVDVEEGLKDENQLFECGWAWSLVKDAPEVEIEEQIGQPDGVANPVPYLYFTVVALDGIQDLFSDRTLTLGLLTPEQQRLAEALRLRWEITQQYWSGIARFDSNRWPLEDIPWRTTGQKLESEYFSLSIAAILVHDLMRRRATDDDLTRTVSVMERLAERGRITSRLMRDDPMVQLHNPGIRLPLQGSERIGPPMQWIMNDFSAQLLKRTIQLGTLSRNLSAHDRLLRLAESIFGHMWRRRIRDGEGIGLWDNVHAAYPESPTLESPISWSITERVTEVMVQVHEMYRQPPIRSAELAEVARALLSESAHILGNEQMEPAPSAEGRRGMELRSIEIKLSRARRLVDEKPGTACALTLDVLGELDALARAREAATQGA